VIRTGEAARRLGVDTHTVGRWANAGKVPAFRTAGGHWRFKEADIDRITNTKEHDAVHQDQVRD
jgi:excisionase family DNA binding protein